MKKIDSKKGGFTLIEIIVSLAVFIVVAVIAVGAFLRILDANKQAQALETAMTNANFALDSMTRDLRVGYGYDCYNGAFNAPNANSVAKATCALGLYTEPAIAFYSSQEPTAWCGINPPVHIYRYVPAAGGQPGMIEKAEQTNCNDTNMVDYAFVPLTSSTFNIQKFGMSVDANTSPLVQPKVFILVNAIVGSTIQNQTQFTIQTTVSQRIMNGL